MDSRFRGNDGGEAGIRRQESDGGGGDSDLHRNGKSWKLGKKNLPFRRTPESLREIPIYIGMEKRRNSAKKRRHSRESGNLFGAINFGVSRILREIQFGIFAYFFCEKRGECGDLSVKMDSRFRGNDGGEAGIRRQESDSGGGDSDLHRNGKSWKLGK